MVLFSFYGYVLIWPLILVRSQTFFELDDYGQFPHEIEKEFRFSFIQRFPDDKVGLLNLMLFIIKDESDVELYRTKINYGFENRLDSEYKGIYFRIPKWQKESNQAVKLSVAIYFSKNSNDKTLEIYDFPAKTSEEREKTLMAFDSKFRIYRRTVKIYSLPTVELTVNSTDNINMNIFENDDVTVMCMAIGGFPPVKLKLLGIDGFNIIDSKFDQMSNKFIMKFRAAAKNHLSKIKCDAGRARKEHVLKVFHNPSQIVFTPAVDDMVENGSKIICSSVDGYPSPDVKWQFISGPRNATNFYEISPNGQGFLLKKNAPLGSTWQMNCSAKNNITSFDTAFRIVKFVVGRPYVPAVDYFMVTLAAVLCGALFGSCVGLTIVCCCLHKNRRRENTQNGKQSRNTYGKQSSYHGQMQGDWPNDFKIPHKANHKGIAEQQNVIIDSVNYSPYLYGYSDNLSQPFENEDSSFRSADNAPNRSTEMTNLNNAPTSSSSSKDDLHEDTYPYKCYL